ncbi:MAG: T9SS type A sorting domain-containing protein [Elusimicrobiota bacterium]|jgi:hypothetical protein|nr:T9SS type A sorting domain-containing protein [Elusimicrobiota bacterium]
MKLQKAVLALLAMALCLPAFAKKADSFRVDTFKVGGVNVSQRVPKFAEKRNNINDPIVIKHESKAPGGLNPKFSIIDHYCSSGGDGEREIFLETFTLKRSPETDTFDLANMDAKLQVYLKDTRRNPTTYTLVWEEIRPNIFLNPDSGETFRQATFNYNGLTNLQNYLNNAKAYAVNGTAVNFVVYDRNNPSTVYFSSADTSNSDENGYWPSYVEQGHMSILSGYGVDIGSYTQVDVFNFDQYGLNKLKEAGLVRSDSNMEISPWDMFYNAIDSQDFVQTLTALGINYEHKTAENANIPSEPGGPVEYERVLFLPTNTAWPICALVLAKFNYEFELAGETYFRTPYGDYSRIQLVTEDGDACFQNEPGGENALSDIENQAQKDLIRALRMGDVKGRYDIFNISGQRIIGGDASKAGNISFNNLPKGSYVIRLTTKDGKVKTQKFIGGY